MDSMKKVPFENVVGIPQPTRCFLLWPYVIPLPSAPLSLSLRLGCNLVLDWQYHYS